MEKMKQQLRRSQFVLMYGPGSIIEGPNGSRLIPSFEGLGEKNCNDAFFKKYEIQDIRMSRMLNDKTKMENYLVSIPSNDAIDENEPRVIYSTVIFPIWHVCYNRNPHILYQEWLGETHCDAYNPDKCGECDKQNNPNVRFVRACPDGHLDEIHWNMEVHDNSNESCEGSKYFYWDVGGSSMSDIVITCPKCGSSTNMNEIYSNKRKCTGRLPEKEKLMGYGVTVTKPNRKRNCDGFMSVIQKQSSSLKINITKTLLKIPQFDESIMDSFTNSWLCGFLGTLDFGAVITKEILKKEAINKLHPSDYKRLSKYLENHEVEDLVNELKRVDSRKSDYCSAIDEEFDSLRGNQYTSANFSKSEFLPYTLKGLNYEMPLNVCAIDKLTTVTAQLYYQRNPHIKKDENGEPVESEWVDIGYFDESTKKRWYPAYKGVGEGLFITSKHNPFDLCDLKETVNHWNSCDVDVSDERPEVKDPLFVWWHTLSHAIIKSLSLSCGYVSASLHERVYIDRDTGEGGILIYNTSPGEDSGMGGLVDIVFNENEFNKVLNNAMNSLLVCSNDPLCSSIKLEDGGVNGAACHNCLLISETSCEHQNRLLDRHFFI